MSDKPKSKGRGWTLTTPEKARAKLAATLNRLNRGDLNPEKARALGYLFGQLLGYFRLERELDLDRRLSDLEELVRQRGLTHD